LGSKPEPEPEPHHVGAVPAWKNDVAPVLALSFALYSEKNKNVYKI
jgi:hypothetical protein